MTGTWEEGAVEMDVDLVTDGIRQISYDVTLDQSADIRMEQFRRSARMRRSFLLGFLWPVGFVALTYLLFPGDWFVKFLCALSVIVMGAGLYPLVYRRALRSRIGKLIAEDLRTSDPVRHWMTLDREGIHVKWLKTVRHFEWASVDTLDETEDAIEFHMKDGGLAVAFKSAFRDVNDMREFMDIAHGFMVEAQVSEAETRIQNVSGAKEMFGS